MPYRHVVIMVLLLLGLVLRGSGQGEAATRLGLHVTQEELAVWRTRAVSGPYRTLGDVSSNSPGDWSRIVSQKESFRASPTTGQWLSATWPLGTCITRTQYDAQAHPGENNRTFGDHVRDAAFFAMVLPNDDTAPDAATKVRALLISQAQYAGTDWTDTSTFCGEIDTDSAGRPFDMATWLLKLLFAYEYLEIYTAETGTNLITTADRALLDPWFLAGARYFRSMMWGVPPSFTGHWQGVFPTAEAEWDTVMHQNKQLYATLGTYGGVSNACPPGTANIQLYDGGPIDSNNLVAFLSNRSMQMMTFVALVGVKYNDAELLRHAKMYTETVITYAIWPTGASAELDRWSTGVGVDEDQGWQYWGLHLGSWVAIADAFARNGDMDLYTWTTSAGRCQGNEASTTAGGPRGLLTSITAFANTMDNTLLWYVPNQPHTATYQYDSVTTQWTGGNRVYDTFMLPIANHVQRSARWKQIYRRQNAGGPIVPPAYPSAPSTNAAYAYGGAWGIFPGTMLMFGDTEIDGVGVEIDPYTLVDAAPGLTIQQPTTSPTWSTTTTPLPILSGIATDDVGVTSVTWTCPTCIPASGTATCASCGAAATSVSWSVATLGLTAGANVFTATAHDGDTQTTDGIVTITFQPASNPNNPILLLPLDGSGSNTAGTPYGPGTLEGQASFGPGHLGTGSLVLDGADDGLLISGTLGLTGGEDLTIAAWVQLTQDYPGVDAHATVVNIGNGIGLRIHMSEARHIEGFWYQSNGAYTHLDATLPYPAPTDGLWHHLTFVWTPTRQALYLDGQLHGELTTATTQIYPGGVNTRLGRNALPTALTWDLMGALDEVRVYARALSQADITTLATATTSGLVLALPLEGTLTDTSGQGHTATLVGEASYGAGQIGSQALVLDGSNDAVRLVADLLGTPPSLTLSTWFQLAGTPAGNQELLSLGDYALLRVNATQLLGSYYRGSAQWDTAALAWTPDTLWHHLAYTVSGGVQQLYLDGVLRVPDPGQSGAAMVWTGQGVDTFLGRKGSLAAGNWFAGRLDEVRVYNRALLASDIAALADAPVAPPDCLISTPTALPTYSTFSATFTTLGGTASGEDPIVAVTWTCTSGCSGSGLATITALPNWTVPTITLVPGANLLTVTCDNGTFTASDTLTVTYSPPAVGAAPVGFRLAQ